jgi:LuxR family maltose regulon positive regulatory protein
VPRTKLLGRLLAAPTTRLVCMTAPSGYGKTTLLAQWAEHRSRRVAWLTLDRHDNDPVVLLATSPLSSTGSSRTTRRSSSP